MQNLDQVETKNIHLHLQMDDTKIRQFEYVPKEDITAYELALIIPIVIGNFNVNSIDYLPDEAKRHFREVVD